MKTMVIAGAGKGLGLSIARRFGKEGFQIVLIARTAEKLQSMVDELKEKGIEASYFVADLGNKEQVEKAIADVKEKYGKIDVVEFSPGGSMTSVTPLEVTTENAQAAFDAVIVSAIHVVNSVVSDMIERGEGALLFTSGLSAMFPISILGNIGISMAGLRNYIANLHTVLTPKGILVANRPLGLLIKPAGTGGVSDPDVIADMWYQVYTEKLGGEEEYPKGVTPETMLF